jgi:hypothetical protein
MQVQIVQYGWLLPRLGCDRPISGVHPLSIAMIA